MALWMQCDPSQAICYRGRSYIKQNTMSVNINTKGEKMDSIYISNHIHCTWHEKLSCIETVKKMLHLYKTSRCHGLFKLEEVASQENYCHPVLIKIGVDMIVDGADPHIVKDILENYILSSQLTNKEFLENMIIFQAVTAIQEGECPRHFVERLSSLFGMEFIPEFKKQTEKEELLGESSINLETIDVLLLQNQEKLVSFSKTDSFDFIPNVMHNNCIQRILREVQMTDLEIALCGCKQSVVKLFVMNLSKRNQQLFFDDLQHITVLDKCMIEKSQKKILNIIKKLLESGEIVFMSYSNSRILTQKEIDQLISEIL